MSHTCHARDCQTPVKPELLMCYRHWQRVPHDIKRAVWAHYRPGQCDDKRPSAEWHEVADAAIGYVAWLEGKPLRESEQKALEKFNLGPGRQPQRATLGEVAAKRRRR